MKKHIIIMAGGTGGHVFPAIAIGKVLQQRGFAVSWLGGSHGIETKLVEPAGFELDKLKIKALRGKGLLAWILLPFKLLLSILQAIQIIRKHKASVVIGMGGYAAGPGAIAAKLLGKKLVLHEQNAIPGLTNKLLAKLADKVFCAFVGAFPATKCQVVGNPIRQEILQVATYKTHPGKLRVLVVGGSGGALIFNQVVPEAAAKFDIDIWQQTGEKTLKIAQDNYVKYGVSARVEAFIDDMATAYAWADLIICRAGALTVSELIAVGRAAILVPYPYAVDDHQFLNAQVLVRKDAGICLRQAEFSADKLAELLNGLVKAPQKLQQLANNARNLAITDSAEQVCNGIETYFD